MDAKTKVALSCAATAVAAATCWLVLDHARVAEPRVSLTFQSYSDFDPYVFMGLTNASSKACLLTMTGNKNTLLMDTSFGRFSQSWMVNCEFRDQTPTGSTNWSQLPSPVAGSNAYAQLGPHSGIVVRVPVPPKGQRRRVAVLYQPTPAGWRQSRFWTSPVGFATLRLLVRTLPKSQVTNLFNPRPVLLRAWCDREITNRYPGLVEGGS